MSSTRPDAPRLMLPGLHEVYEAFVRQSAELPDLNGALQAELWTSAQLGALESTAPHAEGRRAALGDLITSLRDAGTPGGRLFLRALAAMGPRELRGIARRAAGDAVDAPWAPALGRVSVSQVWLIQEGPLDGDRLVCEFRYQDGSSLHALAVRLSYGDAPSEIVVVGDVPALMTAARQAMQAELCVVQPYDAGAVGERLRAALEGAPTLPEECYPALALARHRVDVLTGR
ncbi:hypothetical protein [Spirillospora sp. CA-294931]|uniref:hypothetical protein n=1 Tax=Spirillospora sp. CA-294931 TaxID=3240042 RepID=UPI003D915C87